MSILEYTALELAGQIKKKEISCREAVEAVFGQIEKKEEELNCYISLDREKALKQADAVQKKIDDGTLTGPLAGVPAAVKDNICTKGRKTTCASKILSDFVPPYDAFAAKKLEDAGCILIGKTNMDEFAMGSTTETSAFGVTRNPWIRRMCREARPAVPRRRWRQKKRFLRWEATRAAPSVSPQASAAWWA